MTGQTNVWKKVHVIAIIFHLRPNMLRLNTNTPKHEEFLDATQFVFYVTIVYQNFAQAPCEKIVEATQDKVAEDMEEPHELFQFLDRVNSPSNVRNLSAHVNIKTISKKIRNQAHPTKCMFLAMHSTLIPNVRGT